MVVVLTVSALALRAWRTRPYLTVGWLWYVGTLVPVLGLVPVGRPAPHADRFMYVPMVGLLIVLAWGGAEIAAEFPRFKSALVTAAVLACWACMLLTWSAAAYWHDSQTLFQRAIAVTQDNEAAHLVLGTHLMTTRRCPDAVPHFDAALRLNPEDAEAHGNLGYCEMAAGNDAAAIPHFETALRIKPDYAEAHFNLGWELSKIPERIPEAIAQYEAGLRLKPDEGRAHADLGKLLAGLGRTQEAIAHLDASQRIHEDPEIGELLDRLRAGTEVTRAFVGLRLFPLCSEVTARHDRLRDP